VVFWYVFLVLVRLDQEKNLATLLSAAEEKELICIKHLRVETALQSKYQDHLKQILAPYNGFWNMPRINGTLRQRNK
jgi:hypothetical protein